MNIYVLNLFITLHLVSNHAFQGHTASNIRHKKLLAESWTLNPRTSKMLPTNTRLGMMNPISSLISSPILHNHALNPPSMPVENIKRVVLDPVFEAAALSDMAHFALDIITFMTPETSIVARSFAVLGHLLCIGSYYILDHDVMTQDVVLHGGMLGISIQLLLKTTLPILTAAARPVLARDKRAYCGLFRHAGVSWTQFRTASAAAFDWVDYAPGTVIYIHAPLDENFTCPECIEEGCFYWLYNGDVVVDLNGVEVERVNRRHGISPGGLNDVGLLGNVEYTDVLKYTKRAEKKIPERPKERDDYQETIRAGENGALLLQINTEKLLALMDNDEYLSESIQLIVLKDIQHKLGVVH